MKPTKRRLAVIIALLLVSACETVEGLGRDMEKGGENIEESARESK